MNHDPIAAGDARTGTADPSYWGELDDEEAALMEELDSPEEAEAEALELEELGRINDLGIDDLGRPGDPPYQDEDGLALHVIPPPSRDPIADLASDDDEFDD